jgi:hypothetical protein
VQDFHGGRGIQIQVLTQVDIGKGAFAQYLFQTIISQLLLYSFHHALLLPLSLSLHGVELRENDSIQGRSPDTSA